MKYCERHNLPVPEIMREDIETCYSFGNYDGPHDGLVRWKDEYWYVTRFSNQDYRYWVVELTKEQQEYACWYGKEWARLFHSGMSYKPDGSQMPENDGIYAIRTNNCVNLAQPFYSDFHKNNPTPKPNQDAEVVGYFYEWCG